MPIGGRLYIEVPDATQFAFSPDAPFQEFSIEHINFFSPVSLKNLLISYGFSQVSFSQVSYDQTNMHTGYALRMVFQKDAEIKRSEIVKDIETKSALEHYIADSRREEERIHKIVDELVDCQKPLIVWGVGTHTQRLLATSRLAQANIHAFVDSNPNYHGKDLNGIPIISPQALQNKIEAILISSCVFQQEIEHQIRHDLRLDNPIITLYPMDKGGSL